MTGTKQGKAATRDAIKYSEASGICSFVVELPPRTDPDEYIKHNGLPAFQNLVKNAWKASEWLSKEFLSKFSLDKKEDLERAKIALLEEAKTYKGLLLDSFIEVTTKALNLDKSYILELVKKQHQEEVKGTEALSLKSFFT